MLQSSAVRGVWYVIRIRNVWYLVAAVVALGAYVCILRLYVAFYFPKLIIPSTLVHSFLLITPLVISTLTHAVFDFSLPCLSSLQSPDLNRTERNPRLGFETQESVVLDSPRFLWYCNFSRVFDGTCFETRWPGVHLALCSPWFWDVSNKFKLKTEWIILFCKSSEPLRWRYRVWEIGHSVHETHHVRIVRRGDGDEFLTNFWCHRFGTFNWA